VIFLMSFFLNVCHTERVMINYIYFTSFTSIHYSVWSERWY